MNDTISLAQKGDPYARSILLESNRKFVRRTASLILNKNLQWNEDNELEVALYAFDEAIDIFLVKGKDDFLSFAQKVIFWRIYRYLEKEGRLGDLGVVIDIDNDLRCLLQKSSVKDKRKKIVKLWEKHKTVLDEYGITCEDLLRNQEKQSGIEDKVLFKIRSTLNILHKHWGYLKNHLSHENE